jgi:hypothetical protein
MTRAALALVLVSQLALGADPVDRGTAGPVAIAVESATLRPLDAPTSPVEVGRGVYLPEPLAVEVAAKTAAYDAATPGPVSSPVVWLVVGALVLGVGGGFALGWAARPTAAQ